jgi:hypothetical protein
MQTLCADEPASGVVTGLKQPVAVFNNWSAYDELSDSIPQTEALSMRLLNELVRLKKQGVRIDYYVMDAFWFDVAGGYRIWNKKNWPDGPAHWLEACKANGIKPGLWFSTNLIAAGGKPMLHVLPEWEGSVTSDKGTLSLFEGGYLNHLMETLQMCADQGFRAFKFDFACFDAATDAAKRHTLPAEIEERNKQALMQAIKTFRAKNPEVIFIGYNGFGGDMENTITPFRQTVDPHWLEIFETLYSGDPRISDVPMANFWRSQDLYADHMVHQFAFNGLPLSRIDNCAFMIGTTGTCYKRGKAAWKGALILTLARGGWLNVYHGNLELLNDADAAWFARVQKTYMQLQQFGQTNIWGAVAGTGEPYGYLSVGMDGALFTVVNPSQSIREITLPETADNNGRVLFHDSGFQPFIKGNRLVIGAEQLVALGFGSYNAEQYAWGVEEDIHIPQEINPLDATVRIADAHSASVTVQPARKAGIRILFSQRDDAGASFRSWGGAPPHGTKMNEFLSISAKQGKKNIPVKTDHDKMIWSGLSWVAGEIAAENMNTQLPVEITCTAKDGESKNFLIKIYTVSFNHNYYFDPENGKDANSGDSPEQAFRSLAKIRDLALQPGDSVLLKAGAIFTDCLYISCTGSCEQAIVLGKYGGENRPHIQGDATHKQAVHVYNTEYFVIRDLEISNKGDTAVYGLKGLCVEVDNYGESRDIRIENLFIHDVGGGLEIQKGGGIALALQNARDTDTVPSRFVHLLVANCHIKDCARDGIRMIGQWVRSKWFPNKTVLIRQNLIEGIPGDGIVVVGCDSALVEYNTLRNFPATHPPSEACDGIWPWSSDNTLVQFNVVSGHQSIVDAYAYDSDWNCRNTVFRHNLSYNNAGGFMLVIGTNGWPDGWCINGNHGTQIKYNISINDGLRDYPTENRFFSPLIHLTGWTQNTNIEKNLFYIYPKQNRRIDRTILHFTEHDDAFGRGDIFRNNYIHAAEPVICAKEEASVNNEYADNLFTGALQTPAKGFVQHNGIFDKAIWYDKKDENWDKLIDFVKDKTIPVAGRETPVWDIIGYTAKRHTYYISPLGNDKNNGSKSSPWKSFDRHNLALLQAGDTIFLTGDRFEACWFIDSLFAGTKEAPIVITSDAAHPATVGSGNECGLRIAHSEHLKVEHLKFEGSGRKNGSVHPGVFISNCRNILVRNIDIQGYQKSGLHIHASANVVAEQICAHNNGFAGLFVSGIYGSKIASRNIVIRDCKAENNPGDPTVLNNHSGNGILVGFSSQVLIEYSAATGNGWDMPRQGNGPVGIWAYESDSVLIQYCIAYRNKTQKGAADGGGFDLDGGMTNSTIQYCLSYENEGSGFGLFQYAGASPWYNNTIRHCISENDGAVSAAQAGICVWNSSDDPNQLKDCYVYNNTVYNEKGAAVSFEAQSRNSGFYFCNNIFVVKNRFIEGESISATFAGNNGYCLSDAGRTLKGTDNRNINPQLNHPGRTNLVDPRQLPTFDAYNLPADSPLKTAGINPTGTPGPHTYHQKEIGAVMCQ